MTITYRPIEKNDYPDVEHLISDAFGLHRYVDTPEMLSSVKKLYLASCLSEQKFNLVAVKDNQIVGVIMGGSNHDSFKFTNIAQFLRLLYYSGTLWLTNKNKGQSSYNQVHTTYNELIADCKDQFDGVLTLFAVKNDCRGFGIGKELLARLNQYYQLHDTKQIYLYTDDTCNYGFYEHMGFNRRKEKTITVNRDEADIPLQVYLYESRISR